MTRGESTPDFTTEIGCQARPYLKWAGGKGQLLAQLQERLPRRFSGYHEPFVGSGALFFSLSSMGRLGKRVLLSDINTSLIDTWTAIRDHVEDVIAHLAGHQNRSEHFYQVRAQEPAHLSLAERAARFIYLNRTCFNGLYRENRSGRFNVPFGKYAAPRICDENNLRAVSRVLKGVDISCRGYAQVLDVAHKGDLVYFDPPYHPLSATSSFTSYDRHGFGVKDQEHLRDTFDELARKGVHVMLSNSDTPLIRELYQDFRVETVQVHRSISSRSERRGKVSELIITAPSRRRG